MTDKTSERRARDALDDIDAAVAGITDADIEDRLRYVLRRARSGQPGPGLAGILTTVLNSESTPAGDTGKDSH